MLKSHTANHNRCLRLAIQLQDALTPSHRMLLNVTLLVVSQWIREGVMLCNVLELPWTADMKIQFML